MLCCTARPHADLTAPCPIQTHTSTPLPTGYTKCNTSIPPPTRDKKNRHLQVAKRLPVPVQLLARIIHNPHVAQHLQGRHGLAVTLGCTSP